MKINAFHRAAVLLTAIAAVLTIASCDMLRDGLSSELTAQQEEAVGTATLLDTTWYYNGAESTDITASADSALLVTFTKKVRLADSGVAGSLSLSYTDAAGATTEKTIPVSGGTLASDGLSYALDMSGVTDWFDGTTIPSGTADVTISITGFVCDTGDGKDRTLPRFEQRVMIAPLFADDPATLLTFSTIYSTAGKTVSIPVEASITLDSGASVIVTAHSGSTLPDGFDSADLGLSLASDRMSLIITPTAELIGEAFVMDITVTGFRARLSGTAMERTFTVSCNPILIAFDGVQDDNWDDDTIAAKATDPTDDATAGGGTQSGNEISGLWVTNDGTYLYLAMAFNSLSNMWNDDRIVFMIDDTSRAGGAENKADIGNDWLAAASAMTMTNGQADVYLFHNPGGNSGSGQAYLVSWADDGTANTDSGNWSSTPDNWACSTMGWSNPNGPSFVEYRVALSAVGLSTDSSIRVFGILSNYWSSDSIHSTDIVPGSTAPASSSDVTYDFDAALTYRIK